MNANTRSIEQVVRQVQSVIGAQGTVPLHEPEFSGNEWAYVKDCIDTGWVSSVGAYVDRLEAMLADITGAKFAVATVNGTAALHVALLLGGVQPGDEVLVPTLTFVATVNAVTYANATPHFIDSDLSTLGVDPNALADYLGSVAERRNGVCTNRFTGAPIRAVVPMHTFGHPVDMGRLMEVAEQWGLAVIEDAAEALGSYYGHQHCGTRGHIGTLSFNGNKVVTTGGGGALLTNDAEIGRRAKHITTTARVSHRWSFIHDQVGYNYRMPNINAALGCAQLERLDEMIQRKRTLATRYQAAFADVSGYSIVPEPEGCRSNYWLVALLLQEEAASERDQLLQALNDAGIMARPVWTLMHRLPMYTSCPRMRVACAEALEQRVINLPSSPRLAGAVM